MSKPWDDEMDEPSPEELAEAEALAQLLAGDRSSAALPREVEETASLLRLRDDFTLDADAERRIAAEVEKRAQRFEATRASIRPAAWRRWGLWLLPAAAAVGLLMLVPLTFSGGDVALEQAADAPEEAAKAVEPRWAATRKRFVIRGHATEDGAAPALPQPAPELLAAQLALLENPGGDRTEFSRHMRAYREQMFASLEGD